MSNINTSAPDEAQDERAPAADERDIWLVCLSREYYDGGNLPLLAVPTEAMGRQIATDLRQYCRDLRESLDANNWQYQSDPELTNKLYDESEELFAAAQFPYGVKLGRCDLDDDFSLFPLTLRGAAAADERDARTPADMAVNGGALQLALNVLRRSGKDEVADELEKTASPVESPADERDAPIAPTDEKVSDEWVTASDTDGIAYDGPSFERGYRLGEISGKVDFAFAAIAAQKGEGGEA